MVTQARQWHPSQGRMWHAVCSSTEWQQLLGHGGQRPAPASGRGRVLGSLAQRPWEPPPCRPGKETAGSLLFISCCQRPNVVQQGFNISEDDSGTAKLTTQNTVSTLPGQQPVGSCHACRPCR